MSPDLGPEYSLDIGRIPPHMSSEDYILFQRWRPNYYGLKPIVYYDVGIGPEQHGAEKLDQNLQTMWRRLNQKRIDVLLRFPDRWHIVELRDRSNANAVGRLLIYEQLWKESPPDALPVTMELVTNWTDTSLKTLCEAHRILYTHV